jgi:endonuclease/exonuclease/phosphatase family metal-dependent hydrolase
LSHAYRFPRIKGRWGVAVVLGLVAVLGLAMLPGVADAKAKKKGHQLSVMIRNLDLGADLKPILESIGVDQTVDAAGQALIHEHATKFPSVRAKLLADEIRERKPDVVGLQEVAWYRTGPVNLAAALGTPVATQTDPLGGDFLADLLSHLNRGKKKSSLRYKVAVVRPELDAELPVNDDGQGSGLAGADHNERLTLRDAILVRKVDGVKFSNPTAGTYNTVLTTLLGGVKTLHVDRGWTAVDVKARGRKVHFVNTHLESFDDQSSNNANDGNYPKGGIREAQAKQLVGPGGAASKPRTILAGDLNSDLPVHGDQVFPGDALAFQAVLAGGFSERALTPPPFSCCITGDDLADPTSPGITHRVDHIMSNSKKIRFKKGALTSTYKNGLWSSDHFGIFSQLLIK